MADLTEQQEDVILEQAENIRNARANRAREAERKVDARLVGGPGFTPAELVYASHTRCRCGAGMAYPKGIGGRGMWQCSSVLERSPSERAAKGRDLHTEAMPFVFWSVHAERNDGTGPTTRPA